MICKSLRANSSNTVCCRGRPAQLGAAIAVIPHADEGLHGLAQLHLDIHQQVLQRGVVRVRRLPVDDVLQSVDHFLQRVGGSGGGGHMERFL